MPRPELREYQEVLYAVTDFEVVERLDDVWTMFLRESGTIEPREIEQLEEVVSGITGLLSKAAERASYLRRLLEQRPGDVSDIFDAIVQLAVRRDLGPEWAWLFLRLRAENGFVGFASRELAFIEGQYKNETEAVQGKLSRVRETGKSLESRVSCAC